MLSDSAKCYSLALHSDWNEWVQNGPGNNSLERICGSYADRVRGGSGMYERQVRNRSAANVCPLCGLKSNPRRMRQLIYRIHGSKTDPRRMCQYIHGYAAGPQRCPTGSAMRNRCGLAAVCKWTPLRIRFPDPFRSLLYLRGRSAAESVCYLG